MPRWRLYVFKDCRLMPVTSGDWAAQWGVFTGVPSEVLSLGCPVGFFHWGTQWGACRLHWDAQGCPLGQCSNTCSLLPASHLSCIPVSNHVAFCLFLSIPVDGDTRADLLSGACGPERQHAGNRHRRRRQHPPATASYRHYTGQSPCAGFRPTPCRLAQPGGNLSSSVGLFFLFLCPQPPGGYLQE